MKIDKLVYIHIVCIVFHKGGDDFRVFLCIDLANMFFKEKPCRMEDIFIIIDYEYFSCLFIHAINPSSLKLLYQKEGAKIFFSTLIHLSSLY